MRSLEKAGANAVSICPIAIEQQRRVAIAREALLINNGDREPSTPSRAVAQRRSARVLTGVVSAEHFLLFQQRGLAGAGIVIEDTRRRDEALVVIAVFTRFIVRRPGGNGGIDGLGECDVGPRAGLEVIDAKPVESLRFLDGNREVLEEIDLFNANAVPMRDEDLPVRGSRIVCGRRDYREIPARLIGANVKEPFAVIEIVAMLLLARKKDRKAPLRLVGAQIADLGGIGGFDLKNEIRLIPRFGDFDVEEFVFFIVEELEVRGSQSVTPQLVAAFGDCVFGRQEQGWLSAAQAADVTRSVGVRQVWPSRRSFI